MRLGFGADGLHQAALEHVRGSCFRSRVGELADQRARFLGANFVCDGQSLLDARADGRAAKVVPREPKTGKIYTEFLKRGHALRMSQIILRQSARVERDVRESWSLADLKKRRDFFVDEGDEFVRGEGDGLRIGGTSDEAREERVAFGGAEREKG